MNSEIAARKFDLIEGDRTTEVIVRVFQPEPYPDDSGYRCRIKVEWPSKTQDLHAGGVDAIHAIMMALEALGTIINTSKAANEGRLIWHEQGAGFGLPVPNNIRDLLKGDDQSL